MRVMVITRAPWRNDNNTGNTLTGFFKDFCDVEFYSLCMREQSPQNSVSKRNFFISERQMLKRLCGKRVSVGAENSSEETDDGIEKAAYDAAKKFTNYAVCFCRELIWNIGGWKNENLRQYIDEVKPDIVFFPVFGCFYPHKVLRYIHSLTDAKIVLFHADDNYTLKQFSLSPLYWIYRICLRKWVRRTVEISDMQYCISDVQKADYDKAFGCECKILTKFADFSKLPALKEEYNKPLQLVYTGNININRWKSLAMLANVLCRINSEYAKAQLRIYTSTQLTKAMKKALEIDGTSFLMGSVPSDEIPRIQANADILVHAEATDYRNRLIVRQSFSTKIVDYLKAGRPIVAIGSKEVASIKHLIDHDCAIVVDCEQDLYNSLSSIVDDKDALQDLARKAYECGRFCHNQDDMLAMLKCDFNTVLSKK